MSNLLIRTDGGPQGIPWSIGKEKLAVVTEPKVDRSKRKFLRTSLLLGILPLVLAACNAIKVPDIDIQQDFLKFVLSKGFPAPKGEPQSDDPSLINPEMTKPEKRFFAGNIPVYRFENGVQRDSGGDGSTQVDLANIPQGKTLTITVHGNGMAANRSHEVISQKTSGGVNNVTIAIELPGHGAKYKDGTLPDERTAGILEAVSYSEALEKILDKYENKNAPIALYGVSLGSKATIDALVLLKAKGRDISRFKLFLESPAVSMQESLRGSKPKILSFMPDSDWQNNVDAVKAELEKIEVDQFKTAYKKFIKVNVSGITTYEDYQKLILSALKEVRVYVVAKRNDPKLRYSSIETYMTTLRSKGVDIKLEEIITVPVRHGELGVDAGSEFDSKWEYFKNEYLKQ